LVPQKRPPPQPQPPFESFTSQNELAQLASAWSEERLVAIYDSLPGVTPVETFKTAKTGASKIWESIQVLGKTAEAPAKPKANKKDKGSAKAAAPAKVKTAKKAAPAKNAPKAKKSAATEEKPKGVRGGSKTAQVVAMLQRKNGATLSEIMDKMGWQKHTMRGFMAGAMKKAGCTVESFKRPRVASAPPASTPSIRTLLSSARPAPSLLVTAASMWHVCTVSSPALPFLLRLGYTREHD
jgi:hypothetical protein